MPPPSDATFPECRLMIDSAVGILQPFLSFPENSPLCASGIYTTSSTLLMFIFQPGRPGGSIDADRKFIHRTLRTKYTGFLDALMRLVAVSRSEAQLQQMETRLNRCRCDFSNAIVQEIHRNLIPGQFKDVINTIFAILGDILSNSLKFGNIPGPHAQNATKWPSSTAALTPMGASDAVLSFARLYKSTKANAIVLFLRIILRHCPSLAVPMAGSEPFWAALVGGLQVTVDELHADPAVSGIPSESEVDTLGALDAFQNFLSDFLTPRPSARQDITSPSLAFLPQARKIHDLLMKASHVLERSPNYNAELQDIASFAAATANRCRGILPADQRPPKLQGPEAPIDVRVPEDEVSRAFFHSLGLVHYLTSNETSQCSGAKCTHTNETSPQPLKRCSQCQTVQYCSPACQKAAWRSHRSVCKDLGILRTIAMPLLYTSTPDGNIPHRFEVEARKAGFTDDRIKALDALLLASFKPILTGVTKN
ncbi:hypothetical protein B0H11DRAFT_2034471 [Mycena galericulata]|nr:hypothetical protein B0H11DRAFT_2034471 [Mycena galericulata]